MSCPKCGKSNPDTWHRCPEAGAGGEMIRPEPPPTKILREGEVPLYEEQLRSVYVPGIDTNNEIEKIVIEMRKTHKELMIEKFEAEYPHLATSFKKLQEDQYTMFASKMSDYGLGNISLGTKLETSDEKKMSLSGIFFRVNDKINRWKNMLIKGGEAQNEPLVDSWKDISVYCLIAQLVDGDNWKK